MSWRGNSIEVAHLAGTDEVLELSPAQREGHVYVCGLPGMGKSKLLEHMIVQDIDAWLDTKCGVVVIDPHGALVEAVVRQLAERNLDRPLVVFDLADPEWVTGYNVLRRRAVGEPMAAITAFIQSIGFVFGARGATETPLFARHAQTLFYTLYERDRTLVEIMSLLETRDLWGVLAQAMNESFTKRELEQSATMSERDFRSEISSFVNRLRPFLTTAVFKATFGQVTPSFDLRQGIDGDAIVLVSLSTRGALIHEEHAKLFGTLFLTDLWTAAKERGKPSDPDRAKPCYLYIDEFQNVLTPTIAQGLAQARGFGLHCTIANQYPSQTLEVGVEQGAPILRAIQGLTRTKIVFATSQREDLDTLADEIFRGRFDPKAVKDEIYQTKVVGHEEVERDVSSTTSSNTWQRGSSVGQTRRVDDEMLDTDGSDFTADSDGAGGSDSTTYGTQHYLRPIMDRELSSRQFYSLEEQRELAKQQMQNQPKRHAVARMDGMNLPVFLETIDVSDPLVNDATAREYTVDRYRQSGYALPIGTALARVEERKAAWLADLGNTSGAESTTARRKVISRPVDPPA